MSAVQHAKVPYQSTISGKGGLITETQVVLAQIAAGESLADVREQVISANLLGKPTISTRESIWSSIHRRYLSGRSDDEIRLLARIASSSLPNQARQLVLFYVFAQVDQLLHDFVVDLLFPLYSSGRSIVDKSDVFAWFDKEASNGHAEIASWSPQTQTRIVRHLLSTSRDFGLLEGTQRKQFRRLFVPLPAFVYVLYDQYQAGLSGRQLLEAEAFRLFLLDNDDVLQLLAEATQYGYVTFRRTESIYDLRLHFGDVEEAMTYALDHALS
jgi:hypothetical protein